MWRSFRVCFSAFALLALAAGCATPSIVNLTPGDYSRTRTGFYRIEVAWRGQQEYVREETIQPSVLIGRMSYPMRPVRLAEGRWETMVPVASDRDFVDYRFKFDFVQADLLRHEGNSRRSDEYRLNILDEGW